MNKKIIIALSLILIFYFASYLYIYFYPHPATKIYYNESLKKPSMKFLLGTDEIGRDIFSQILYAVKISLNIAVLATVFSLFAGTFIGIISATSSKKIDNLIMRIVDMFLAFPDLLFAIGIAVSLGAGFLSVIIAITFSRWAGISRLIRAVILDVKEKEFVLCAKSLGASKSYIILKHLLPQCIPVLAISFSLGISGAMLSESSLSFLGLGIQSPIPSLGRMVDKGREFITLMPVYSLAPALVIAWLIFLFNFLGDCLQEKLNIRFK